MSKLGTRWVINGVPAACVVRRGISGCYSVIFERSETTLEAIESIDWKHPEIIAKGEDNEGLPAGCGFELADLTYQHAARCFAADLKVSAQYLGDVSAYRAEIHALNAQLDEQKSAAEKLEQQLQNAYEEGVESHG